MDSSGGTFQEQIRMWHSEREARDELCPNLGVHAGSFVRDYR